jgi:hypothetical protein
MIELEIQGLSPSREGLLIEVGRFVMANGFTLQRQRLAQDPHGILLTMVVPQLLALQQSVAEAARASSLALAGKRTGSWVFRSEYLLDDGLDLREAIERIGVPALRALVEVDQQGTQLHIHDSPLCAQYGHSGCSFFGGFLEGLLGPAIAPGSMSIFPVCCRSYGADACVLELSD